MWRKQDRVMSHIQENSSLYIFNAVLLLMGVIFGAILVNSLQINQNKIYHFIYNVFGQVSKGEFAIAGEMFRKLLFAIKIHRIYLDFRNFNYWITTYFYFIICKRSCRWIYSWF